MNRILCLIVTLLLAQSYSQGQTLKESYKGINLQIIKVPSCEAKEVLYVNKKNEIIWIDEYQFNVVSPKKVEPDGTLSSYEGKFELPKKFGKRTELVKYFTAGKTLYAISEARKSKKIYFFIQKFDEDTKSFVRPIPINIDPIDAFEYQDFSVVVSEDASKIAIIFSCDKVAGIVVVGHSLTYTVFDRRLNVVQERTVQTELFYKIGLDRRINEFEQSHKLTVDSLGNLYRITSLRRLEKLKEKQLGMPHKKLFVKKYAVDPVEDMSLEFKIKDLPNATEKTKTVYTSYSLNFYESYIVLAGLCVQGKNVLSTFIALYDYDTGELDYENTEQISPNPAYQSTKRRRMAIFDYEFTLTKVKNGFRVMIEEAYVSANGRELYYDDVLLFAFSENAELRWSRRIQNEGWGKRNSYLTQGSNIYIVHNVKKATFEGRDEFDFKKKRGSVLAITMISDEGHVDSYPVKASYKKYYGLNYLQAIKTESNCVYVASSSANAAKILRISVTE